MKQDERLVEKELAHGLKQVIAVRAGGIAEARNVQLAFHALLEHEAARLADKLGPEHPRAVALRRALDSQRVLVAELEVEAEIAAIRLPKVNEDQALVHGRVVDRDNRGFAGLKVCLVDKSGEALPEIEPVTTDVSGHYAVVISGEMAKAAAYLDVTSPRERHLYRGKRALKLVPGTRLSVDVKLDRSDVFDFREQGPAPKRAGRRKKKKTSARRTGK